MVRPLFVTCALFGLSLAAPARMIEGKRSNSCHRPKPGGYHHQPSGLPHSSQQEQPPPNKPAHYSNKPQQTNSPPQPTGNPPQQTSSPPQQTSDSPQQTSNLPQQTNTPPQIGGGATPGGPYKTYTGSGQDWPTMSQWVGDFETLWKANVPAMQISCAANGWGANNSPAEIQAIHDNLQSVASANGLDPRFLLAIMMQESKGCVRVKTTANAHPNPGLMQSGGQTSCVGVNPCPASQIKAMIEDGVTGPDGLKETMAKATGPADGLKLYRAAVLYNSGINLDVSSTLAGPGAATPCYASDIVNRLLGTLTGGASQCSSPS